MFGLGSFGGFGFGWIFMVLFLGLIILGIVYLIRGGLGFGCCGEHGFKQRGSGEDGALNILKERYAKGEIDKKEFDKKKKDLAA